MIDQGHIETELVLEEIEKEIAKEYRIAEKEIQEKMEKYIQGSIRRNTTKLKLVEEGKMTQQEYEQWLVGQMATGSRWNDLRDVIAHDLTHADAIARSITFGHMPEVYAINHNYGTFQVEKTSLVDTSYVLYDRQTVERLFKGGKFYHNPGKIITERINERKDLAWNKRQVQSVMIQAILQGNSVYETAKRLRKTVGDSILEEDINNRANMTSKQIARELERRNRNAAVRNARTMTTGVQNAGRVDSYKRAEGMGIELMQEWLAIMDGRTRHEHRLLDGQRCPVGQKFHVEGYDIEYPGDPEAEGFLIYNCRCTLLPALKGFSDRNLPIHQGNPALGDMTYEEWKYQHVSEQDMGEKIKDIVSTVTGDKKGIAEQLQDFQDGLENAKIFVKRQLEEALERVVVKRGIKTRYIHDEKKVILKRGMPASAMAHELFHNIDRTYGITKKGAITDNLTMNYVKLAVRAGDEGVAEYLRKKYPEAFKENGMLKKEYAPISDIIHGCSDSEIFLGSGHLEEGYWKRHKSLEKETFAQAGRIYYDNNMEVIRMFERLFPDVAREFKTIMRGL